MRPLRSTATQWHMLGVALLVTSGLLVVIEISSGRRTSLLGLAIFVPVMSVAAWVGARRYHSKGVQKLVDLHMRREAPFDVPREPTWRTAITAAPLVVAFLALPFVFKGTDDTLMRAYPAAFAFAGGVRALADSRRLRSVEAETGRQFVREPRVRWTSEEGDIGDLWWDKRDRYFVRVHSGSRAQPE